MQSSFASTGKYNAVPSTMAGRSGDDFNYVTMTLSYVEHAVSPLVQAWRDWTGQQRLLAVLLSLPLLVFPVMPIVTMLPFVLLTLLAGYVLLFGLEVTKQHVREAWHEHYDDQLLKELRANFQAQNGFVFKVVHFSVELGASTSNYALSILVTALDLCVSAMTGVSSTLKEYQKKTTVKTHSSERSPGSQLRKAVAKPLTSSSVEASPNKN
jgi:hypothetical protein